MKKIILGLLFVINELNANDCEVPEGLSFTLNKYIESTEEDRAEYREILEYLGEDVDIYTNCMFSKTYSKDRSPTIIMNNMVKEHVLLDTAIKVDTVLEKYELELLEEVI